MSDTSSLRVKRERRRRGKKIEPEKTSGGHRVLFWIFTVVGGAIAAAAMYFLVVYPSSAGPGPGKDVELTIVTNGRAGSLSARHLAPRRTSAASPSLAVPGSY